MDPLVLRLIADEISRAEMLHGPLTTDKLRALAILTEEVGEVAKAVLEEKRIGKEKSRPLIESELSQVAVTAILMLTNLRKDQT